MGWIGYDEWDESYSWDPRPWYERPAEREQEPEEPLLRPLTHNGRPVNLLQAAMHWRRRALAAEARLAMYEARKRPTPGTHQQKEKRDD